MLHQYEKEIEEYRVLISNGKTKKAYKTLNWLIKINPLARFLVVERIRLADDNPKLDEHLEKDKKLLKAINEAYKNAESNLNIEKQ